MMNTLEMKNKFLSVGIPFDELDEELINVLFILNFKLKLRTKYSCFGHGDKAHLYIMFHESNDTGVVEKFAEKVVSKICGSKLHFYYYVRRSNKVKKNWVMYTNGRRTLQMRHEILNEFSRVINEIELVDVFIENHRGERQDGCN